MAQLRASTASDSVGFLNRSTNLPPGVSVALLVATDICTVSRRDS